MTNEYLDAQPVALEMYWDELYLYAFKRLKNKEQAEDAVADVFVRMYEKGESFKNILNIKGYLFQSVQNACMDVLRKASRTLLVPADGPAMETISKDGWESSHEHNVIRSEMVAAVWKLVSGLPDKDREIFLRRWLYKEKFIDIAADMDLTPQTVSTHYKEALKQLKIRALGMGLLATLMLVWLLRLLSSRMF